MRKLMAALSCVMLICALAVPAYAAGSSVTLTPTKTEVHRGDTFAVEAYLDNSDEIRLCTVVLTYDEDVLELTGGTCELTDTFIAQVMPDVKAGTCILKSEKAASGKAFTFTFKVKEDAILGDVSISATAAIGLSSGEEIDATGTAVTVACAHVPGPAATTEKPQTCTACGAELAPVLKTPETTEQATTQTTGATTQATQTTESTGTGSTSQTTGETLSSSHTTEQTAVPEPLPTAAEPGEIVLLIAIAAVVLVGGVVAFLVLKKKKEKLEP